MPPESELQEVIGALQSEVELAVVSELGAAGIDRARISFLAQEDIAAFCAGAVGCDVKQLPRVEISLSDDRQEVRTPATSLVATVASLAGAGAVLAATGGAVAPALLAGLASGGSVGGLAALFGRRHEGHVHEWAESQILNGGIVLIVHPASAERGCHRYYAPALRSRRLRVAINLATSLVPDPSSALAGGSVFSPLGGPRIWNAGADGSR